MLVNALPPLARVFVHYLSAPERASCVLARDVPKKIGNNGLIMSTLFPNFFGNNGYIHIC